MPPLALISSAAMCSTLETVFSEIAMPPVRELRKPSLMVVPEVSIQLGAADLLPATASPARAPQPASTRATVVAMAPVATSVCSRLLGVDICGNSVLVKELGSRHSGWCGGACPCRAAGVPSASPGVSSKMQPAAAGESRLLQSHCSDISRPFQLCNRRSVEAHGPRKCRDFGGVAMSEF